MTTLYPPVLPDRVTMPEATEKTIFCTSQRLSLLCERTGVQPYLSDERFFLDRHPELRGEEKPKARWRGLKRHALVHSLTVKGTVTRLFVVCSAGLGKSTNLQWLAAKLAAPGSKEIPFFFELGNEHLPGRLVDFFETTLPDRIHRGEGNADLPDQHIRAALKRARANGRITLLLDGVDQAGEASWKLLTELLISPAWKACPIVLSARPHAVFDRWKELIVPDERAWRFLRVEPLGPVQRKLLLDQDGVPRYRRLPAGGRKLMATPRNIEYVLEMDKKGAKRPKRADHRPGPHDLPDYTLADLRTASHVFAGAADNMVRLGMLYNPKARMLRYAKELSPPDAPTDGQVAFGLDLLGALAYTMYCRPAPTLATDQTEFRPNVSHIAAGDMEQFHKKVLGKLKKAGVVDGVYRLWDLERDLDALAELNHAIQYDLFDTRRKRHGDFRWYDRSLQEFFAAWWLSRYAGREEIRRLRLWRYDDTRDRAHKSLYEPLWGYLAEMPVEVRHDAAWVQAVGVLFEPDAPRCCEMIYRSWPGMIKSREGWKVIRNWRQEFKQFLRLSNEDPRHVVAAEIVQEDRFKRCPPDPASEPEEFPMGSPTKEKDRRDDEFQHPVMLSPFRLYDFPVTNAQYELFDPKHSSERWGWSVTGFEPHPVGDAADDYPAVNATWFQAWCFARWVGPIRIEGKWYRLTLPTEAQWEYGCRAGTKTAYHAGESIDERVCNYGNSVGHTTAKGKYPANAWALYDMHGNVWEWCLDWYAAEFYNSEEGRLPDPCNKRKAPHRVLRGGGWYDDGGSCRSANRYGDAPDFRYRSCGFRLAAVPVGAKPVQQGRA
jgi:formylglycine-generating enzyme required for sulfatase activity